VGVVDLLCSWKTVFVELSGLESVVCESVYHDHQYDIAAHIVNKIFLLVHQIVFFVAVVPQLFCCL
jgi:hypothetical protein